jgi:hypothetical protein
MILDTVLEGVEQGLGSSAYRQRSREVAKAVSEAVVEVESGRQLLVVDPGADTVLRFDLMKAIFGAAGVLGGVAPLLTGAIGVAAVLAALGAIGALQGVQGELPDKSAQIIICLLPEKELTRSALEARIAEYYPASTGADLTLLSGMELLQHLGCIHCAEDYVKLREQILVRW